MKSMSVRLIIVIDDSEEYCFFLLLKRVSCIVRFEIDDSNEDWLL
jgi:hypothetical protein